VPFFEPLPPEPEFSEPQGREWAPPLWDRPSEGVLPAIVPITQVVHQSEDVVLAVDCVRVYPNGFVIELRIMLSPRLPMERLFMRGPHHRMPRLGIEFSDGRRAGSEAPQHLMVGVMLRAGGPAKDEQGIPTQPILMPVGGGGGGHDYRAGIWVFPLPSPGELKVYVEWPTTGLPETMVSLDADAILSASKRAVTIWE
jgi:hypothetical protein